MNFSESYVKNLTRVRFLTLITASFLISLLFFELAGNLYTSWYPHGQPPPKQIEENNIAIIFQSFIFTFFFGRMILVCFTKPKFVWVSQGFWLLHWLTLFSYAYVSAEIDTRGVTPGHFPSFFLTMLNGVSSWFLAYMIFSPIKQILTLIFSYFYRIP